MLLSRRMCFNRMGELHLSGGHFVQTEITCKDNHLSNGNKVTLFSPR